MRLHVTRHAKLRYTYGLNAAYIPHVVIADIWDINYDEGYIDE